MSSKILAFWNCFHVFYDTTNLVSIDINSLTNTVADLATQFCKSIVSSKSIAIEIDNTDSLGRPCLRIDVSHCGLLVVLEPTFEFMPFLSIRSDGEVYVSKVSVSCLSC